MSFATRNDTPMPNYLSVFRNKALGDNFIKYYIFDNYKFIDFINLLAKNCPEIAKTQDFLQEHSPKFGFEFLPL